MDLRTLCALPGAALLSLLLLLPAPRAGAASDEELVAVKAELAATRAQLGATQEALARVEQRLDAMEASRAGPAASAAVAPAAGAPRLAPVNADNPAISFVVDTTARTDTHGSGWDFALRSGELFVSAPVDPFLRGFATINGSSEEGFDLEEAALVTTALPWNLTVEGGRFFADVGRLPHWHEEALPFVDRPPSIDRLFGGETQAQGVQVTWLAPIDHYVSVTAGLYDTIGAEASQQLRDQGFAGFQNFDQLTWLVHPKTYFDLTDTLNLELGGTFFTVQHDHDRRLYGVDATLRHQPGTSELYQGLTLGTEWYWNDQRFSETDANGDPLPDQRFHRNGGYAYLETFLGRRYSVGVRGDFAVDPSGPSDRQITSSVFATWFPSEFQRLRFQFDQVNAEHAQNDQRFTLQWTAFLGSHSHGFTTR